MSTTTKVLIGAGGLLAFGLTAYVSFRFGMTAGKILGWDSLLKPNSMQREVTGAMPNGTAGEYHA